METKIKIDLQSIMFSSFYDYKAVRHLAEDILNFYQKQLFKHLNLGFLKSTNFKRLSNLPVLCMDQTLVEVVVSKPQHLLNCAQHQNVYVSVQFNLPSVIFYRKHVTNWYSNFVARLRLNKTFIHVLSALNTVTFFMSNFQMTLSKLNILLICSKSHKLVNRGKRRVHCVTLTQYLRKRFVWVFHFSKILLHSLTIVSQKKIPTHQRDP